MKRLTPRSLSVLGTYYLVAFFASIAALQTPLLGQSDRSPADQFSPTSETTTETISPPSRPPAPVTQDLPIVGPGWRAEADLPWSKLVRVQEQTEEYIGVIDRNYPTGTFVKQLRHTGLLSNWSRNTIQLYSYHTHRRCTTIFFVPICKTTHPIGPVDFAQVKVGSQIFNLVGQSSYFAVSDDLAYALQQANPEAVLVRFYPRASGNFVIRTVGADTVKTWPILYRDATVSPANESTAQLAPAADPTLRPDLPIVDGATWAYVDDLPWSVPVKVQDPFEGDYIAVLDSEFSGGTSGLKTNWRAESVLLYIYSGGPTGATYRTGEVDEVELKIADQTFRLVGHRNRFSIDSTLGATLRNAPSDQVSASFLDATGKRIEHKIGNGTIQAWRTVYQAN